MRNSYASQPARARSRPIMPPEQSPAAAPLLQSLLAITSGLALFFILTLALVIGFNAAYRGKIYPGVSVAGVDLSGLTPAKAASLLTQRLDYPSKGQIAFLDGTRTWVVRPGEVGLFFDFPATTQAAYQVGRKGNPINRLVTQFQTWSSRVDLAPMLVFDERIAQHYLSDLAAQIDIPIIEASLGVNGVDVVVHSGQVGRSMDIPVALVMLRVQVQTLKDGMIPLVVQETPPVILDASAQAEIVRKILSAPLVLSVPDAEKGDPGPWKFDRQALAGMLAIERVNAPEGARYQVALNTQLLRAFLEGVASNLRRDPQNARFTFNDDKNKLEVLQASVTGRHLDVDLTIQEINQKLTEGEHNLPVHIAYTQPQVSSKATAEDLGITELVSNYRSYFYGSSAERIHNIEVSSARFHGLLVAPGEDFSMGQALGDVSLDTGYAEALIIIGDRTIKGVGGGVCQVSTSLFRTVFFGGYKIIERHWHAYRVGYYEQTASGGHNPDLAGLDATVFFPMVDFRFQNDTPYWLLMETYVNADARTLTWKFYSTSDGRSVDWDTTGPTHVVEAPPPLYEENPDLAKGEIKQTDWEAQGADVTVRRTVTRDGVVLYEDTFFTHYLPWRAVYQYGPGTKHIPTPVPTDTP